jgi:hypothetical protein
MVLHRFHQNRNISWEIFVGDVDPALARQFLDQEFLHVPQ